MTIEVGKLYSCSEYFIMLYPDRETAASAHAATTAGGTAEAAATVEVGEVDAAASCSYWTRKLGKPVSFCDPETPLLVLSIKEEYIEVLAGNQKGWIIYRDWLNIKDIR